MGQSRHDKVAVVGAGIGGLAIAGALNKGRFDVEIFERAPQITPVGSGLTLWPNATRVLRELEVLSLCESQSSPLKHLEVKLSNGRKVMDIPTEEFETPAIAMHRADLHQALLKAVSLRQIHLGFHCQTLRETSHGVYLISPHREVGPFDIVIGADGIHSTVRSYVSASPLFSYKGYLIWRGISETGDLVPQNGIFSETWGNGRRFGILPIGRGRVCWYATINVQQGCLVAHESKKEMIAGLFEGWHAPISQVIERTSKECIIQTDTLDCPPPKRWSKGRVVLMGDAIHPIAANLGQGSCMALEDAIVLSDALKTGRPPAECFSLYEKIRRPRVTNLRRRSSWIGNIGQWQQPLITPVRNLVCSMIPGILFTKTSRNLHAYRAEDMIADFLTA